MPPAGWADVRGAGSVPERTLVVQPPHEPDPELASDAQRFAAGRGIDPGLGPHLVLEVQRAERQLRVAEREARGERDGGVTVETARRRGLALARPHTLDLGSQHHAQLLLKCRDLRAKAAAPA